MTNKKKLLFSLFAICSIFLSGCVSDITTSPVIPTTLSGSPFSQNVFQDNNIYPVFPAAVTYLPVQSDSFSGSIYPSAAFVGRLVLENGTFRLKPLLGIFGSKGTILVWPPGFSARTVSNVIYITDENGDVVAFVGDEIEGGGGEVPADIVEKYTGQPVPQNYPAPYWLVSEVKRKTPAIPNLSQAKPYTLMCEGNLANDNTNRSAGIWIITSNEASNNEEWAQTSILAVADLQKQCGRVFTGVSLAAGKEVPQIEYAQASYASDGKGALGMTGSAPAHEGYWRVQAATTKMTDREYAIAKIWNEKQKDFPSTDPLSSLSYDLDALRKYTADTLGIPIEVVWPIYIPYTNYPYDSRL